MMINGKMNSEKKSGSQRRIRRKRDTGKRWSRLKGGEEEQELINGCQQVMPIVVNAEGGVLWEVEDDEAVAEENRSS